MVKLSDINKFYVGLKIIQDGEPCVIISSEFVKPGKGQSFNRVRFRKLITSKIFEKTFKSGSSVELANIEDLDLIYLYNDGMFCCFMHSNTFEHTCLSDKVVGENKKWLVEQLHYTITFWNHVPIFITPPNFVELKVLDIQPAIKGDTVFSSMKLAVLSTGVVIKVPLFINKGEFVKIDTRSSEYVSRVIK